jgi:cell shape-determining protein MreD
MGPALLWFTFGYASCVWDCSSSPLDPRWPSATGVFVVLLAMRVPQFSIWGAALCGLVMDAAQGDWLGPRVVAGVIAAAFASHANLGRSETHWSRAAFVSLAAIALWLAAPHLPAGVRGMPHTELWTLAPSLATTTLSTALVVLAIRYFTLPADRSYSRDH